MAIEKFSLTIEDKVLLHLLRYFNLRDDYEQTVELTQPGIAQAVEIRRSHASYVLKNLKEKGLVSERVAHVKDLTRKRKVYFLTENGNNHSRTLKTYLFARPIRLKESSGELKNIELSELYGKYSSKLPLVRLLNSVSTEGLVEEDELFNIINLKPRSVTTGLSEMAPVTFIDNMAQPSRFVGRENEINIMRSWIATENSGMFIIKGIPGMGKTTLLAKIISEFANDQTNNIFWFRFHSWSTIKGTLYELGSFLGKLGKKALKFYIEHEKVIELDQVMGLLTTDLQEVQAILIFDDFQKTNEELRLLFSMLVEMLEGLKGSMLKIIILTRQDLNFYDRRNVAIKKLISEFELVGLDSMGSKELLNLGGLNDAEFKEIFKLTEGHPLSLELISNHFSNKGLNDLKVEFNLEELFKEEHDINKYIREEIFYNLGEPEKQLLNLISIYRNPVQPYALFVHDDIDFECIDSLVSRALIHETTSGFEAHELLKEFFYRRLTPKQKSKCHQLAAEYYVTELLENKLLEPADLGFGPFLALEAQYHFLNAGMHSKAAELVVEFGDKLISTGYSEEFFNILAKLDQNTVSEHVWPEVLIHKGHILTFNGHWDDALVCFEQSLELSRNLNEDCLTARAFNGIGVIHFRKGDLKLAMQFYQKGLDIAQAADDKQNCSKLNSNIALVHWSEGDLDKAIELTKNSLALAETLNDTQGIARAYNNLGIIYWEQRKLDQAIEAYNRSLELSETLGDKHTIAILYDNLGEAYRLKELNEKAEEFYMKSLALSEQLGFMWQIGEVNSNLGIMYKNLDQEKSSEYFSKALEMYSSMGAVREVEKLKKIMDENIQ
jgi:tetratricopeptide (TPR) repeat protein/DNA-binding PadR family transcriptional regulator